MDTKYYASALSGWGWGGKLQSPNSYQPLVYLRSRQATRPDGPKDEGILLYSQVESRLRADVRLEGFRIQARSVNLNQPWQDMHCEMLRAVAA